MNREWINCISSPSCGNQLDNFVWVRRWMRNAYSQKSKNSRIINLTFSLISWNCLGDMCYQKHSWFQEWLNALFWVRLLYYALNSLVYELHQELYMKYQYIHGFKRLKKWTIFSFLLSSLQMKYFVTFCNAILPFCSVWLLTFNSICVQFNVIPSLLPFDSAQLLSLLFKRFLLWCAMQ